MQRQKRQIIKTRPQRPYIVARIILIGIAVAAVALGIFELISHLHPAHAFTRPQLVASCYRQEGTFVERMAPIPVLVERMRS